MAVLISLMRCWDSAPIRVELAVAMPLSWLPLISDYTREAEKPVQATVASVVVYGLVSCWMYVIGMGAAIFTGEYDIAVIMVKAGLGIAALVILVFSTVTTTFLDAWSAGISAESLSKKLNGKKTAIAVTVIVGLVAPQAVALIGFLMFGNLIRECGVLNSLSETAQNVLANLITILLGLTIASRMNAAEFLRVETLLILGLGLVAFVMDTVGGVMIAKLMNLFLKEKINPMIGAAGISAFPMSARVVHKMGLAEDKQNFLLMHAAGVNVSGQIASVIAGGLILALVGG